MASYQYIFVMQNLTKVLPGGRELFKNITLSFFPGAKIGVLGVNGAGKSTLLKIMAGIDKDFSGEAWAADGVKIGYLEQEPQLDPNKNVMQNVMDGLGDIGVTEMLALINEVLPYVTTDLTDAKIIEYATAGLNALSKSGEIKSTRIPQDDAHYPATIRGMSVLVPDLKMCQEDLMAFTGEE